MRQKCHLALKFLSDTYQTHTCALSAQDFQVIHDVSFENDIEPADDDVEETNFDKDKTTGKLGFLDWGYTPFKKPDDENDEHKGCGREVPWLVDLWRDNKLKDAAHVRGEIGGVAGNASLVRSTGQPQKFVRFGGGSAHAV
jgi:hypothetical protein